MIWCAFLLTVGIAVQSHLPERQPGQLHHCRRVARNRSRGTARQQSHANHCLYDARLPAQHACGCESRDPWHVKLPRSNSSRRASSAPASLTSRPKAPTASWPLYGGYLRWCPCSSPLSWWWHGGFGIDRLPSWLYRGTRGVAVFEENQFAFETPDYDINYLDIGWMWEFDLHSSS